MKEKSDNLIKTPTKIQSFGEVQKALQDLAKQLNDLGIATNSSAEGEITDKDGKTGDIRVTQNADKTYGLELKTEEGWKFPTVGESPVQLTSKKAEKARPDIVVDKFKDDLGNPKNLPSPDYEAWFDVNIQKIYITGATTGEIPPEVASLDNDINGIFFNGASGHDAAAIAGEIIGIPKLDFELTGGPSMVQLWIATPGCRSFQNAIDSNQGVWQMQHNDYVDIAGTSNSNGCGYFAIGANSFCIATAENHTFSWEHMGAGYSIYSGQAAWYDAFLGSGNGTANTSAYCLRIWK